MILSANINITIYTISQVIGELVWWVCAGGSLVPRLSPHTNEKAKGRIEPGKFR